MSNIKKNENYMQIVDDILNHEKFQKLNNCIHHGTTRLEHSLRVSYYSYKITKKLKLNYIETARGGLLHDFFENDDLTEKKQKLSAFFHPYYALENAKEYFNITELEKDIIINHMFPTLPHKIPKNLESWIVSLVDKGVATYEFYESYGKILIYKFALIFLVIHW